MRDGQAVMARNVMDDSQLGNRDSRGEILATSVICAPVRLNGELLGREGWLAYGLNVAQRRKTLDVAERLYGRMPEAKRASLVHEGTAQR